MRWIGVACTSLAAALSLAASLVVSSDGLAAAQNAQWGSNYFPNVTLTTHRGEPVRFYDDLIKGKIVAINLIYTTCKYACPLETARLAQVQKLMGDRMGRDVFFYSITIDPEVDTPAVLREYAQKFEAGPGWVFLTGRREDIDLISKKTGLYSRPDPSNPDGHTPHLLVGNEATGQWLRHSGVDDPRVLATTIGSWLNSWQTAKKPTRSYADAPRLDIASGAYTFRTHCAACHTIGGGDRTGPDLLGVTSARDPEWLRRYVLNPNAVRSRGDAAAQALTARYAPAVMPTLGLAIEEAAQVIDYIAQQSARPAAAANAAPATDAPSSISLGPIIEPYLRIQQALNGDRISGLAAQAHAIEQQVAALGNATEAMRSTAAALGRATDIAAARSAFAEFTTALLRYARQHNVDLTRHAQLAYCPMLQRYWLQHGTTVQNPYYGQRMSDCGNVVLSAPPQV